MNRKRRFIAEWEDVEGILLALPHHNSDWDYILKEAEDQYIRLISALTEAGEHCIVIVDDKNRAEDLLRDLNQDRLTLIEMGYNDTWTRDYGPISVMRDDRLRAYDFGFNGWGLKFASDLDNLVNLHMKERYVILPETYRNERGFVLEGGSIETDGKGTLLTTTRCLTSPNRNGGLSKSELNERLMEYLGTEHILWVDYGELAGDDTDSHIDTLCRMAPGDTIIFTGCRDMEDEHFESLLHMRAQLTMFRTAEGNPYNLVELPLPRPIYDEEGNRLPATYANYLVTEKNIFMPVYSQPDLDKLACDTIRIAFPEHTVIPVECSTLIKQHGSLHCSTMQLPKGLLNPEVYV